MSSRVTRRGGIARDLTERVNGHRETAVASQRSEVPHPPVGVKEGVSSQVARRGGFTRNLTEFIDGTSGTGRTPQRAEVPHSPVGVEEGGISLTGGCGFAGHLAEPVDP